MINQEINNLIDKAYTSFQEIKENFYGSERTTINEKEERFYKTQFKNLGVKPSIVSEIHTEATLSSNKDGIQELKNNIETRLIKK
jgi:hypothetical protein